MTMARKIATVIINRDIIRNSMTAISITGIPITGISITGNSMTAISITGNSITGRLPLAVVVQLGNHTYELQPLFFLKC